MQWCRLWISPWQWRGKILTHMATRFGWWLKSERMQIQIRVPYCRAGGCASHLKSAFVVWEELTGVDRTPNDAASLQMRWTDSPGVESDQAGTLLPTSTCWVFCSETVNSINRHSMFSICTYYTELELWVFTKVESMCAHVNPPTLPSKSRQNR